VKPLLEELEGLRASVLSGAASPAAGGSGDLPSIAVFPFVDMSPGKDQEYFCEGIAEELTDSLTKLEGLQVAARTSAFQLSAKGYNVRDIGRQLRVRTVLEGSVRKAGNRIRITAQLVNIADGFHLWSEKYDRELDDIFAIQDEISLAIVEKLRVRLLGDEKVRLVKRFTRDQEAHSLYLRGRYFWNRRYELDLRKALDHFQLAVDRDPLYALPYVGVADSYISLGWFGFLPPKEAFTRAKAAANKALVIDGTLGEAHTSLGYSILGWDWDWEAAERELSRALELSPEYATGHQWYGVYLAAMGRIEEAVVEVRRAQELDPLSLMINSIAGAGFYLLRRYDDAVAELRKVLEMEPTYAFALVWLGLILVETGDQEGARAALRQARASATDMAYVLGFYGAIHGRTGYAAEAREALEFLQQMSHKHYVSPSCIASVHLGLGQLDEAFEYLDKALAVRDPQLAFGKVSPWWDGVRDDPRFAALLKKIGLEP
jgi:serine/threonine-protein kinase